MMNLKAGIVNKCKHNILAEAIYRNGLKYYVKDFLDKDRLIYILYECLSHETYLTKSGYEFLKKYYGLATLAKILQEHGGELASKSEAELIDWLKLIGGKKKKNITERRLKFTNKDTFYVIEFKKYKK